MIVSASRRTDIPAFFSDWFFHRIRQGYCLVRQPMNPRRVARVKLTPDVVDAFVFWSKNPTPLLDRLDELGDWPFYFQFTLNPYGDDIEPFVPSRQSVVIPTFKRLADRIGPERIMWRYDPIVLSDRHTPGWHEEQFDLLAKSLAGYAHRCTISFLIPYRKISSAVREFNFYSPEEDAARELVRSLVQIGRSHGFDLYGCSLATDFSAEGLRKAHCIDHELLETICGSSLRLAKDTGQRKECGCVASIDIGTYGTCAHGCCYCYASHGHAPIDIASFDPTSPILGSLPHDDDQITDRKAVSAKELRLF